MSKYRIIKNRGFTLIELLVVISIIALLSSVVLASTNQARTKAQNTAVIQGIRQYINAIHLYAEDNNGLVPPSFNLCLGLSTTCTDTDTSLKTALSKYISFTNPESGATFFHPTGPLGSYTENGTLYFETSYTTMIAPGMFVSSYDPTSAIIIYHLQGANQSCVLKTVWNQAYSSYGDDMVRCEIEVKITGSSIAYPGSITY